MTNEQARNYFKSKGLTYSDVTEGDILSLVLLLNKYVKRANKNGEMSVNTMRMSQKIKSKYNTNGTLKECYLFINSHYFTQREAVSFNKNGFIGFAGELDSRNTKPIIDAFVEWVDKIAE